MRQVFDDVRSRTMSHNPHGVTGCSSGGQGARLQVHGTKALVGRRAKATRSVGLSRAPGSVRGGCTSAEVEGPARGASALAALGCSAARRPAVRSASGLLQNDELHRSSRCPAAPRSGGPNPDIWSIGAPEITASTDLAATNHLIQGCKSVAPIPTAYAVAVADAPTAETCSRSVTQESWAKTVLALQRHS